MKLPKLPKELREHFARVLAEVSKMLYEERNKFPSQFRVVKVRKKKKRK